MSVILEAGWTVPAVPGNSIQLDVFVATSKDSEWLPVGRDDGQRCNATAKYRVIKVKCHLGH